MRAHPARLLLGVAVVLCSVDGGRAASAQTCGFPWTITVTPIGPQAAAVNLCGSYSGCLPHDPVFTVSGSVINISLTSAEPPGCQCIQAEGTFRQIVLVEPLSAGPYQLNVALIECGQPIPAGSMSFVFSPGSAVPTLSRDGLIALALLIGATAAWRLAR
jgi:hypothetical protein